MHRMTVVVTLYYVDIHFRIVAWFESRLDLPSAVVNYSTLDC